VSEPPRGGEGGAEDLDGLIRRVDHDRWLSSRFVADPQARADVIAIYAFDHELRRARLAASQPLLAEIRLTWWSEVLDEIYGGAAARRHATAQALAGAVARGGLPREHLEGALDARFYAPAEDPEVGEVQGAGHVAAAAALRLDRQADAAAASTVGQAWARREVDAGARAAARRLSAAAFPAVAHATLAGGSSSDLMRRLRLTWAVARGRI
jgi:phytoene synthase